MANDNSSKEKQEYEARLQRRLQILKKQLDAGKISFAEGLNVTDSLQGIRYAPDGSIDLSTVDGAIRALALAVTEIHDREELKKSVSLAEIQNDYFGFLEQNFGRFYKTMEEKGLTPHDMGMAFSRNADAVADLTKSLPKFLQTIDDFWLGAGYAAHAHVEDMKELKGVFGGDLFPSPDENIASKCGLYMDTLILPDPFLRSRHVFARVPRERQAYFLIKHALNLLQYKALACADITPPIVVVLPDLTELENDEKQFFLQLGKADAVTHAGKVFGRKFGSFEEVMDFAHTLDTVERVTANISDKSRVLFDTDWKGSLQEQIFKATQDPEIGGIMGVSNPGVIVAAQALGRMSTSNELLIKARRLGGTPIIEAATSWQYLVWKMEYEASHIEARRGNTNLHIVRGLQNLAENKMEWLGRIPVDALIEIRKTGAFHEIRGLMGKGIDDLATANPDDFNRTSGLVFDNIQGAFAEHRKNIETLKAKQWKFAKHDIGSFLVVGSMAVTAAATGSPTWGLAAYAADQLFSAPKLTDIPKSISDLAKESSKVKRSPVGLLFRISQMDA